MTLFLALEPLDFLLRYNVVIGIFFAIVGASICMMAKRITMVKRHQAEISKQDKLYSGLKMVGLVFILLGMICIALPFEASFYRG